MVNSWSDEPLRTPEPGDGAAGEETPLPEDVITGQPATGTTEPVAGSTGDADAVDFHDRWLRAEAELQNFRKRARRDLSEASRSAEEAVMLEIIGALDDLERALQAARESAGSESLTTGVELVATRLREYLSRQGITVLDPVGETFDPNFHEALMEVEPPPGFGPGEVVQVALRGYRRGARALRAARVVVARRAPGSET